MEQIIYPDNLKNTGCQAFFTEKNFSIELFTNKYQLYLPIQRHTDNIIIIDKYSKPQVADSVLTDNKELFIGIKVADCLPVLLYDPVKKVIGAIHGGWRSTAKAILKKTILKMVATYGCKPSNILIAMGPSIKGCCYEVGDEVIEALKLETPSNEFVLRVNGKSHVDLATANLIQAISIGVKRENIWICSSCTRCNTERFASYRYEGKKAGRQYGIIGML
ncbi:MAG: peptidoglycan editing factor PgeF [Thermodesulfovibrio sp.]|uniref:peptidoglycan editing factor PgeF n=1 Tax=Thermodesulfovibrio sp. 1176 TaxID=3043424 RepID=UPI002483242B|nr:peptidoglycan editing factor PgeF [Thermodesulfovibrio sp. 1176]MDI1471150.1 peptidoglycan editing factor PgeF [Thermodesulfovibrio sp. 1176]MDI6713996.1 peptidoglycan editing factor PgeF [Thermodesulfovibrio sp.]